MLSSPLVDFLGPGLPGAGLVGANRLGLIAPLGAEGACFLLLGGPGLGGAARFWGAALGCNENKYN